MISVDGDSVASDQRHAESSSGSLTAVKHIPYLAPVQDVLLLSDCVTIVVALKGSNYLRLLDLRRMQAREGGGETSLTGSGIPRTADGLQRGSAYLSETHSLS